MTKKFKDHFSGVADGYRKYRPDYPDELFAFLSFITPVHDRAWDCGTGSGQTAKRLAQLFLEVIATDASQSQISKAKKAYNIRYFVCKAEKTRIDSASIDLITVSQALHWFNTEAFFQEADRVLKPGGVLAVWCYGLLTVRPDIDAIIKEFYLDQLGSYWPEERKLIESHYETVRFPYREIQCPDFSMETRWDLHQLTGYFNTWSAVARYQKQNGTHPFIDYYDRIANLWGDSSNRFDIRWPLDVKVRVKPE